MTPATGSDTGNKWEVSLLPTNHVDHYWENILDMLDKVPHTWEEWTKESLYERIIDGNIQVWGLGTSKAHRAFMFTQIAMYPAKRVLEVIWFCGEGTLENVLDILDATGTRFAQIQNCSHIEIIGRPGWKPYAKSHGFRLMSVRYSRAVPRERIN
jgi:hypothetical protein